MRLVVNSNIIISALIKDSTSREIIFTSRVSFLIPEEYLNEVLKYKSYIKNKARYTEEEFNRLLSLILKYVIVLPSSKYAMFAKKAEKIMGKIDKKDIPYVAIALAIKADGIWTEDKDFKKQNKVKAYNTQELLKVLRKF